MRAPGSLQPVHGHRILPVRAFFPPPDEDRGAPLTGTIDDAEDLDGLGVRMPEPDFRFGERFGGRVAIVHGEGRRGSRGEGRWSSARFESGGAQGVAFDGAFSSTFTRTTCSGIRASVNQSPPGALR